VLYLSANWDVLSREREAMAGGQLVNALDQVVALGALARDSLAAYVETASSDEYQGYLESLHLRLGIDAAAVLAPDGSLLAWVGTHHGPLPSLDRLAAEAYPIGEGPLFRYLYFPAVSPATGELVVVAELLAADLPPALGGRPEGFLGSFSQTSGVNVSLVPPAGLAQGSVWDLVWEDQPLLSLEIQPLSEAETRRGITLRWGRVVSALILVVWGLLAFGSAGSTGRRRLASGALFGLAMILPFGALLGVEGLFDPATFLLPPPVPATLGRILAAGLAAVWVLGFARGRWMAPQLPPLWVGALGGIALTAAVALVRVGASGGGQVWMTGEVVGLQLAMVLLGSVPLRLLLTDREAGHAGGERWVASAVVLGVVLGLASLARVRVDPSLPLWWPALWAVPVGLAARGTARGWGHGSPSLRWGLAIVLVISASVPVLWGDWVEGRRADAGRKVAALGMEEDPYRRFLLYRWGEVTDSLAQAGVGEVELLFRSWVTSGLAEEGAEADLTLWSPGGLPREELRIGITGPRSSVARELQEGQWPEAIRVVTLERSNAQYVGLVRLASGSVATAVLPPRRRLPTATPLGPLLTPDADLGSPLTLIPLVTAGVPPSGEGIWSRDLAWRAVPGGWRGEARIPFPEGPSQASYFLELPTAVLLVARGTLLAALDLFLLLGVWGLGVISSRGTRPRGPPLKAVLSSFRGRVTVALFLFFLLPTTLFGTLVFRTLSSATQRTSEVLADRAVESGARAYFSMQRALEPLSQRVGSDLLLYVDGRLVNASSQELFRLGLYEGWIPRGVYESLERRETLRTSSEAHLGDWTYLLSFRRIAGQEVLAAPSSVDAGQSALRPAELAHLLAFALLMGAGLSLALALLVGRALAQPLQTLLVASERVGGGNLSVRLPDDREDEFGGVFVAFNRMVRRISSSREELVKTTERTEAIVEEAAAGVIALDPFGRVTLANARSREILGVDLEPGQALPEAEGPTGEVAGWIGRYFRDGLDEAAVEFQFDERRIRIRSRRIRSEAAGSGAVVILEDVTDELRSERILAWGEMARQVAHEVKNPLTPMKLSVQHIRRAWDDQRSDFGDILSRNADTVLSEIDRLDGIARGFSRMAPPEGGAAEDGPHPVDVAGVVADVVGLYAGGGGAVSFEAELPESLPSVVGRESELREVLINLFENAREAVGSDGWVRVTVSAGPEWLEIEVLDNGPGIPPEVLPRVLEPHFSTRTGGTGLGLAIVDRVVRSWGGAVTVSSPPGDGTRIRLSLPVFAEDPHPGVPPAGDLE
jgi:signal transduction histidine kinase